MSLVNEFQERLNTYRGYVDMNHRLADYWENTGRPSARDWIEKHEEEAVLDQELADIWAALVQLAERLDELTERLEALGGGR